MKFHLTNHVLQKLEQRKIPIQYLETLLKNPQQILPDKNDRKIFQSQFLFENGKTYLLRAIVTDSTKPAIVLTVYKTNQIKRYWRNP
jgi:Domain of unknown function (DUF4258)